MFKAPAIIADAHSAVTGFRVPALPLARGSTLTHTQQLAQVLKRFAGFVRALHINGAQRAVALHVMAHPRITLEAEVGIYLLCRASDRAYGTILRKTAALAEQMYQLFPTESLFNYDVPLALTKAELQAVTWRALTPVDRVQVVELRKFVEPVTLHTLDIRSLEQAIQSPETGYIYHPLWADTQLDPWLTLINALSRQREPTVISVALEPAVLHDSQLIAAHLEKLETIVELGSQRHRFFAEAARARGRATENRSLLQTLADMEAFRARGLLTNFDVVRARRGVYAYAQLLAWQDQLFTLRVTLATTGEQIPSALTQAVSALLCTPAADVAGSDLGWMRPEVIVAKTDPERTAALRNLQQVGLVPWGTSTRDPLRHLVTAQEAVGLFHLPVMPQAGQTTAVSTAAVPFVIPSEVLAKDQPDEPEEDVNWLAVTATLTAHEPGSPAVLRFGYLYQRGQCLKPDTQTAFDGVPFTLRLKDLKKPSLLVGAPGSGKSNLALYLLIQLWRDHRVPFLVLDPSTGHEYRYLYAAPALRDELVVYTVGDNDTFPLRFNPFAVPPGVTVRAHITRLLACFKAAYEMWDPLPAVYEAALARVYKDARFGWHMDEKWGGPQMPQPPHAFPCLADLAQAIEAEIEENVKPTYGRSEAGSTLTGASQIRINGVLNSVGHVINVRQNDATFFQTLLEKPVVIELGALGDPSILALVMAFLITQLAGYIEHAAPPGDKRDQRQHLLLIDEAHRLLSGEVGGDGAHQGNVRGKSAEELNTLLTEVRKFGQGIMVLDQRPSSLVGGVLDNALINIMCRLNDRQGFEHLSHVLNLSPEQQQHAHTSLKPGDALMLDMQSGQPVLLRAPNVVDALGKRHNLAEEASLMQRNAARAGLRTPEAVKVTSRQSVSRPPRLALLASEDKWAMIQHSASLIMRAPFRACAYCRPLQEREECPHRKMIYGLTKDTAFHARVMRIIHDALRVEDIEERWRRLSAAGHAIEIACNSAGTATGKAQAYCYLAHVADSQLQESQASSAEERKNRGDYWVMLFEFDKHYTNRKE